MSAEGTVGLLVWIVIARFLDNSIKYFLAKLILDLVKWCLLAMLHSVKVQGPEKYALLSQQDVAMMFWFEIESCLGHITHLLGMSFLDSNFLAMSNLNLQRPGNLALKRTLWECAFWLWVYVLLLS